nr:copia protein [Tanacetum cinerariifolium]
MTILNTLDSLDKAGEGNVQQYVLFPLWSFGSKDPQNTNVDTTFKVKESESKVHVSQSSSAKTKKHDDKTNKKAKGKSHVELSTRVRNLSEEFKDFTDNNINGVNAASTLVPVVGQNSTNSTNTFSGAGPSNTVVSPTVGRSSYVDHSPYLDDPDMPDLEDITYSDDEEDRGKIDQTLFIKKQKVDIWLVQVYVNDIIFGSTNKDLCKAFDKLMKDKFQMSSMGKLTFFLGLQVKKKQDRIFISQVKYVAKILRKFSLTNGKSASTPIDTKKPLLKDPDGEDVDGHTYRLMIGSLMYLTSSRLDIMFVVYACACFQVTSKASHLHAV